jgi:c(7)-type cytochrome triheme protein
MASLPVGTAWAVEGDVIFGREAGVNEGVPLAVFPHWFHRIRFRCYVCHPAIFEMKAGANKITTDAINEGKFCGTCHNGKIAWGSSFDTCNRCHVEQEEKAVPANTEERAEKKPPATKEEVVGEKEPAKKEEPPEVPKKEGQVESAEPVEKK